MDIKEQLKTIFTLLFNNIQALGIPEDYLQMIDFDKIERDLLNNSKNEIISNLTTKKSLPEILKISLYNNQIINFKRLPIYELYPVNSEVEVYYNPSKPKESYVERNIKPSKLLNLILLGGIILMIFSLYLISKI